jgi:hypothetical protein
MKSQLFQLLFFVGANAFGQSIKIQSNFQPNSAYEIQSNSDMIVTTKIPGNEMMEEMMLQKSGGKPSTTSTKTTHLLIIGAEKLNPISFRNTITNFSTEAFPVETKAQPSLKNTKVYGHYDSNGFLVDSGSFQGKKDTIYNNFYKSLMDLIGKTFLFSSKEMTIGDSIIETAELMYPIQPIGTLKLLSVKTYKLSKIEKDVATLDITLAITNPNINSTENAPKLNVYGTGKGTTQYHISKKMIFKSNFDQILTQEIDNSAFVIKQIIQTKSTNTIVKKP